MNNSLILEEIYRKFWMFDASEPGKRINEVGFAKVATLQEIKNNGYVLAPGSYAGIKIEDDGIPFEDKMKNYSEELSGLLREEEELKGRLREVFKILDWEV